MSTLPATELEISGQSDDGNGGTYPYEGGNKVISSYSPEESIQLNVPVTDVEVSGDDFVVVGTDGTLTISDCRDKVISFLDANGGLLAYAYMTSTGDPVDGRGISAFEIIIGANNQSNLLMASGSGSSLYGGNGEGVNTLQGGLGQDTFVYTDGSGVIRNVSTGDKINFGAQYTGFEFTNDDILLHSTAGDLLVQSIRDQVVDVADGDGNFACHVLMAGSGGTVDGATLSGYEVISGANDSSNVIFAGNYGSSLYGGNGQLDTLIGGDGEDWFMFGYNSGADTIKGAYSNDFINLLGVRMDDITEINATAGLAKFSLLSGAELTVDGTNGAGYSIEGKIYDIDVEANRFVERT